MHVTSHSVYFYSSIVVICTHCLCMCTFPSFYILIGSSDSLNLHMQVYGYLLYWAGIRGDHVYLRSTESFLLDHKILWYNSCLLFHSVDFFWFSIAWTPYCQFDLLVEWYYHVWKHYMYYCSDLIAFIVDLYNLLGYFRLSVYTRGIFLTYIRRRLSSRLRSIGKRHVTMWYCPLKAGFKDSATSELTRPSHIRIGGHCICPWPPVLTDSGQLGRLGPVPIRLGLTGPSRLSQSWVGLMWNDGCMHVGNQWYTRNRYVSPNRTIFGRKAIEN